MCLGGGAPDPGPDPSIALRQQEAERQARVAAGTKSVDDAFASYGDDYFTKLANDYTANYLPQIDDQYNRARMRLPLNVASTQSSAYADMLADLTRDYEKSKADLGNQATDFVSQQRNTLNQQKQQLYALASSGSDPLTVGQQALSQSNAYQAPKTYSPLGDLFAKYTGQQVRNAQINNSGYTPLVPQGSGSGLLYNNSKKSGYVVN